VRWEKSGRSVRRLILSRAAVEEAERWRDALPKGTTPPSPTQREFITASRARLTRITRITAVLATLGLVVTLGATVVAVMQLLTASEERDRAQLRNSDFLAGLSGQRLNEGEVAEALALAWSAFSAETQAFRPSSDNRSSVGRRRLAVHSDHWLPMADAAEGLSALFDGTAVLLSMARRWIMGPDQP